MMGHGAVLVLDFFDKLAVANHGLAFVSRYVLLERRLIARKIERRKPVPCLIRLALCPDLRRMHDLTIVDLFIHKIDTLRGYRCVTKTDGDRLACVVRTVEVNDDAAFPGLELQLGARGFEGD